MASRAAIGLASGRIRAAEALRMRLGAVAPPVARRCPKAEGVVGVEDAKLPGLVAIVGAAIKHEEAVRVVSADRSAVECAESADLVCVKRAAFEHAKDAGVICVERAAFEGAVRKGAAVEALLPGGLYAVYARAGELICADLHTNRAKAEDHMAVFGPLRAGGDHGGVASGCRATVNTSMCFSTAAYATCWSKAAIWGGLLDDSSISHRCGGRYAVRARHGATDHGLRQAVLLGGDLGNTNAAYLGWGFPLYRSKGAASGNATAEADGEATARRSEAAKVAGAFSTTAKGADGKVAVRARRSGHPMFAVLSRPSAHLAGVLTASAQSTALCLGGRRCFSSGAGDAGKEKVKVLIVVIRFGNGNCAHHFRRSELYAQQILDAVETAAKDQRADMLDTRKVNKANLLKHGLGVVSVVILFIVAGGWYAMEMLKTFIREKTDYFKKTPARLAGAAGSYTMDALTSTWGVIVEAGDSCKEGLRAAGDWIVFWRRGKKMPVEQLEKVLPGMDIERLDATDLDGLVASLDQKKAERKAREQREKAAEEKLAKIMEVWFVQYW